MTEILTFKLSRIIDKFYSIYEKGFKKHTFSNRLKSNSSIYCYSEQIPDIFVYYDIPFARKNCFFIDSKKKNTNKSLLKKSTSKIIEIELKDEGKNDL